MSEAINFNPEKEPIPRSWVPRVIQGGKMPPDPPSINWLKDLDIGTVFVCSVATWSFGDLYRLLHKGDKFYLLAQTMSDGRTLDMYVNPPKFCEERQLYEVLGLDNLPEEGDENEQCNRTD